MAFGTAFSNDQQSIGGGERQGLNQLILSATVFENGLKVGRFAKVAAGSIDNFDGSATPEIAGVVLRNVANKLESGDAIDSSLYGQVEYIRQGLTTVYVKSGETPAMFDRVYISNAGDANDGLATATNTDVPANAEFIAEMGAGIWLIYVNPAPGDVAAHIADPTAAHAASAISLLDALGLTTATDVEAVIAEILPRIMVTIADPGNAGAIPVTRSGSVAITTAGAETRTLAIPTFRGQELTISCDVYVGDAVITVAAPFNQTGNNTITLNTAGDTVKLTGVQVGGALVWRLVVNDGAALTTV